MEFRIALRSLLKRPFLNLIKVVGLSLALTGTLVILLFIKNQISYDSFHRNSDRIYRLTTTSRGSFGGKLFFDVEGFAYKTEMSWWIFCIAGLAAVLIAFASIFYQAYKAAVTNPIEILRND